MNPSRIMIVEDNTTVSEDCRDRLESLGYSVTSIVSSGEESIVRAETERPDAVIMDIKLRDDMDGIEAA
ncbi:MAG: response regulator, partial [Deltaproteobacteria bacterium]|nr:response regulator [Deltaproteobacteria bacterium]